MKGLGKQSEPRLVYGINVVVSLLDTAPERIMQLFMQDNLGAKRLQRMQASLDRAGVAVSKVSADQLAAMTGTAGHQGVAASVQPGPALGDAEALELLESLSRPLVLLLDSIEDPRNFGACLRSADAAGADLVVIARSRNVGLTPVVSKTAAGAAETQPIAQVSNLARFMASMRELGIWLIGTDGQAEMSLFEADLAQPTGFVLGAEGRGLRRLTRERCDLLVSLPLLGSVESLNVSVATGVCLYEAVRQRSVSR